MYCLKCGKETTGEQIFCDHCLDVMEAYPIKPGTPVQLPNRNTGSSGKKSLRPMLTMEEQIHKLKIVIRVLLCLLLILSCVSGFFLWSYFRPGAIPTRHITPDNTIGQNYTVEESTDN